MVGDMAAGFWAIMGMEWQQTRRNAVNFHLRLAFGCEGGGGGGRQVETSKKSTPGSRLDVREVVAVGDALKGLKNPPPAHVGHEGGGGGERQVETSKKSTSCSRLDAREVVLVADMSKSPKVHLMFGCEGGGKGGRRADGSKEPKETSSSLRGRWSLIRVVIVYT